MSFDLAIVAGDLQLNKGDLTTISGVDKLEQDLVKICLTEAGSNPLQPWYGSLVSSNLIGSNLPIGMVISSAQNQLQRGIETLKQLQMTQVSSGQKVSPDEQISYIQNISLLQNQIDPRILNVTIRVLNRAFGSVSTTVSV